MRITKIILIDYKRFSLRNIKRFVYEPEEQVQLVLGTNGSGKSSLLKELTPLPASSNDYLKTGSKEIHITHRDKKYVLTSRFSPKQEHSFICNEEELNLGGTIGTQKELVRDIFNITPDIHELLISSDGFTLMSPSERRSWFTRLSDTNYTYAIGIYNKVKEKHRDTTGSIKHVQSRLMQEKGKVLAPEEIELVETELSILGNALRDLINVKSVGNVATTTLERQLTETDAILISDSYILNNAHKAVLASITEISDNSFTSLNDFQEELELINTEINSTLGGINVLADKLTKERNLLTAVTSSTNDDFKNINDEITSIQNNIDQARRRYKIVTNDTLIDNSYLTGLDAIMEEFIQVTNSLDSNIDYRFSRNNLLNLDTSIKETSSKVLGIEKEIITLSAKIKQQEEVRDHDKITCPKCNHVWSKDYDESYYQSLVNSLTQFKSLLSTEELKLKALKPRYEEMVNYFNQYRIVTGYIKTWSMFNDLWDIIITEELLVKDPKKISMLLSNYREDIITALSVKQHTGRLNELLKVKQLTTEADLKSVDALRERIKLEDLELTENYNRLRSFKDYSKRIKEIINTLVTIQTYKVKIDDTLKNKNNLTDKLKLNYRNDAINTLINEVKIMLSQRENSLVQISMQDAVIESLEKSLEELLLAEKGYKSLVETLSPMSGLIAEGLTGFINTFIKQVNHFVEKIWSYPLEIVPIEITDDGNCELDYKFEVRINSTDVIPDISKGSGAMREVIDLAFKIVSMKYLGLSTYPVYLDEFAKTLDHAHRTTAHRTVVELITQSDFSQVFIVNHYADLYMSIRNADITVLHDENIIIPKDCIVNQRASFS